jgi:hypothetical protein
MQLVVDDDMLAMVDDHTRNKLAWADNLFAHFAAIFGAATIFHRQN